MFVEVDYSSVLDGLEEVADMFGPFKPLQTYYDQLIISNIKPYVPHAMESGVLERSVYLSRPGSGKVVWNTPYAGYVYRGYTSGPIGAGLGFDTSVNPLATAGWPTVFKEKHHHELTPLVQRKMAQLRGG